MSGQERQVLHVMPAWVRRLYLGLGLAYLALGAVRAVQEPTEWRGWANLALAAVWLLGARAVSLGWVLTPEGVGRPRFLGGWVDVPWSAVAHVGHDAERPAFRTGGQLRLADGNEVTFRGWSDDDVRRARAWWEASRGDGGAD